MMMPNGEWSQRLYLQSRRDRRIKSFLLGTFIGLSQVVLTVGGLPL